MRKAVNDIWKLASSAFDVLPILIAVRDNGQKKVVNSLGQTVPLYTYFQSADGVIEYLKGTGLATVLESKAITNLADYVFGVETGLDSNARKNRSGAAMADTVAGMLRHAGVDYRSEVRSTEWKEVAKALGDDKKRFDFVFARRGKTYLCEVNFYSKGGGSKLNEVARAYKTLGKEIGRVPDFEFVWITDGQGWLSARSMLQETYLSNTHVYNLTTLPLFLRSLQ